jgi:flagellar biosynthesis/type III secretory pathway M-ring protein FliF/YscJ
MKEGAVEKKSRTKVLVIAAIAIVAIVLLYIFVIKPSYSGYVVNLQSQASNQTVINVLDAILVQVNKAGYITLPVPNTNQTVTLILPQLCSQYIAAVNASSK